MFENVLFQLKEQMNLPVTCFYVDCDTCTYHDLNGNTCMDAYLNEVKRAYNILENIDTIKSEVKDG